MMMLIVFLAFFPTLVLTFAQRTYQLSDSKILVLQGPFLIRIVQNSTNSLKIKAKDKNLLDKVNVWSLGFTFGITLSVTNRSLTSVQAVLSRKDFTEIIGTSGVNIVSDSLNLKSYTEISLGGSRSSAKFQNLIADNISISTSDSSSLSIENFTARFAKLTATTSSTLSAKEGSIRKLNATGESDGLVRLNNVVVKNANLTASGSQTEVIAYVTDLAVLNKISPLSEVRVDGPAFIVKEKWNSLQDWQLVDTQNESNQKREKIKN